MRTLSGLLGLFVISVGSATACEDEVTHVGPDASSAASISSASSGGGGSAGMTSVGGQGGAPSFVPTPEQVQACTDYWTTQCARYEECLPLLFGIYWGDQANCVAAQSEPCTVTFAPGSAVTPATLASCTAAVGVLSCNEWLRYLGRQQIPAECEPTPGALADADTCISNSQCQSTYCGYPAGGASCGTCQPRGQANDPCEQGGCELGLTCLNNTCRAVGDVNASCSATAPCMIDLDCVGGSCAPALLDGDPCTPFQQQCATELFCNNMTNQCEPVGQQPNGSACGFDMTTGGLSFCENGAHCSITAPMAFSGVCSPAVGEGGDCSGEWATGPCTLPLRCVQGSCESWDANACL